jgi:hypothetical protein
MALVGCTTPFVCLIVGLVFAACPSVSQAAASAMLSSVVPGSRHMTSTQVVTKPRSLDRALRYTVHFCRVPGVECGIDPALRGTSIVSDVLVTSMPDAAVRAGVDDLMDDAVSRSRRRLRGLSSRQGVAVIATGVLVAGSAFAGVAVDSDARRLAMPLRHLFLRVPGLPMTVRLDPLGPDPRLLLRLDVAAVLSSALGRRWRWLRRVGPRRRHTLIDLERPFAP